MFQITTFKAHFHHVTNGRWGGARWGCVIATKIESPYDLDGVLFGCVHTDSLTVAQLDF